MPKQRKLSSARISNAAVKKSSDDVCGFWNLFVQSKDIISKNYESTKIHFNWLNNFLEEAQARIENVQIDSTADNSQLDRVSEGDTKDSSQAVLSSQENGGTRRTRRNVQKDVSTDNSQLDGVCNASNQAEVSCQENRGPKRRRKKRSSKLRKSSVAFKKTTPVKSTSDSDVINLDEDKENINENISFKTGSDSSQDIIVCSPLCKSGRDAQVKVGTPVVIKAKDPIVVLEPLVTVGQSSESTVTQSDCNRRTSVARLTNRIQEKTGADSSDEVKEVVVVLERLTDGKSTESNQCTVSLNDGAHTNVNKLSRENEVKTIRTSSTIKCRDSVVVLEPLVITQCTELGKSPLRTSNRISGKRKLTEVCDSSHLMSESVSRVCETPRSSRTSDLEPVSKMPKLSHAGKSFPSEGSDDNCHSKENLEPVSKMPKLSHMKKSFSSEGSDDNKRNTMLKPHVSDTESADSGTCCIGSSGESVSGSQRSNTSISSSSAKESLNALKNCQLQSFKKNGQLNSQSFRQRSQESIGYHTPEKATAKKDFNNSALRLQSYKTMLSQSRTTPKSTFVFSSSKTANQLSRSKLLSGSYSTKPCTPLRNMNTSILKSQAIINDAEKEKYKQEEAKRQQEREQAVLKKQQLLQMKVEEQKRKREARMQKNLEARQQLDREKAERHKIIEQREKKLSNIAKEKAKEVKKSRLKIDSADECGPTKKLTDKVLHTPIDAAKMHHKGALSAKPVVLVVKHAIAETAKSSENKSVKPGEPQAVVLNSTFVKSDETPSDNYEMTPAPARPRSTYCNYDISDLKSEDESEDENAPSKPIPLWAVGSRFKQALINQYYNPLNLDELFGPTDVPDLNEMFAMKRSRYLKRTSSAVWNTPDRLIFAVKPYS